jgi:fimbrial chaperone protein
MVTSVAPVGRASSQAFRVVNTSTEQPVAVELYMAKRDVAPDGTETWNREVGEENFLLYPPQTILQPGEEQVVRVTWLGEAKPDYELAYRLIAEQVPVDFAPEPEPTIVEGRQIRINSLVRYAGSVYITPENVAPDVVIESAEYQQDEQGNDLLVLTFYNQGTAHTLLENLTLTLTPVGQPDQAVTLSPEELSKINRTNILAQHRRRFVLPWHPDLPVGEVEVSFDYQQS